MKFKKLMCTLAALALAGVAFAGNTSEMRGFIDGFFSSAESGAFNEEEPAAVKDTKAALKAGLLTYEEHKEMLQLTLLDQEIDTALEKTIPTALNKVKKSLMEVQQELSPVFETLTRNVLKNQEEVNIENTDFSFAGKILSQFVFAKLLKEEAVLIRVGAFLQGQKWTQVDPRVSVNKFFESIEEELQSKGDPSPSGKTATTVAALKTGLMTYAEHKVALEAAQESATQQTPEIADENSNFTAIDREIGVMLEITFPEILNKIKKNFLEVQVKADTALEDLTKLILDNQQNVAQEDIDNIMAKNLVSQFVFTKVQEDGSLLPKPSSILSAYTLDKLINIQLQEEENQSVANRY